MRQGAPSSEEIIKDLATNDEAIASFVVHGVKFFLRSPELTDAIIRGRSTVAYEKPARLYIEAREPRTGVSVLKLAVSDGKAHAQIRTRSERREEFWTDGEPLDGMPIQIPPTELVREIFLPEAWNALPKRQRRLIEYDESGPTATLEIGPPDNPRRIIQVTHMTGPAWVITRNVYLEDGDVVANTQLSDYRDYDGIRFPLEVHAVFPKEDTDLSMVLTKSPTFNESLNYAWFRFAKR